MENLKPQEVVAELDRYVVGQAAAKRALAVALRNRYRRRLLPEDVSREILPKNVLMIGPTGVGKTELARRVARLIEAPFVKVEASKFTEVGYVGRDVESIVHELAETAVTMVHEEQLKGVQSKAEELAAERIVLYLCQQSSPARRRVARPGRAVKAQQGAAAPLAEGAREDVAPAAPAAPARPPSRRLREHYAELLQSKQLEDTLIEIELIDDPAFDAGPGMEYGPGFGPGDGAELLGPPGPDYGPYPQKRLRKVSVKEARRLLTREEAEKLVDFDQVVDDAVQRAEQSAVVFIDELDKIAGPRIEVGADVSGEGVQRDLLPIVEGSTVMTRYGPVRTDHVLFIGAGAFYQRKPSDLIPELQGRFPLRVELASLTRADFERILVEPSNALTKQYAALLSTEGVELAFAPDGVARIAEIAAQVNERAENTGARRLYTVVEQVLEEISFSAPDHAGERVLVDAAYVDQRLGELLRTEDLGKYIL